MDKEQMTRYIENLRTIEEVFPAFEGWTYSPEENVYTGEPPRSRNLDFYLGLKLEPVKSSEVIWRVSYFLEVDRSIPRLSSSSLPILAHSIIDELSDVVSEIQDVIDKMKSAEELREHQEGGDRV